MMADPSTQRRLKRVRERLMSSVRAELQRGDISATEMLALMAHTTGACLAWQDQREMTPERALKLISDNIEAGNREALYEVLSASGRAS